MEEDWKVAWQPVIDAVGTDLGGEGSAPAREPADALEIGILRRYLEPLEFDSPLHYDRDVAQAHGYPDIIAPYTSMLTFSMPPMWRPGTPAIFTSADKHAQPKVSAVRPSFPSLFPPFSGYFATDLEMDYIRPIHLGERVTMRGAKLKSCEPKETSVGRGAFVKTEAEVVTAEGEVVARMRTGMFYYNPHKEAGA